MKDMKKYLLPLLLRLLRYPAPGPAFLCLNAIFPDFPALPDWAKREERAFVCLNRGGNGWELGWEAHAMSLLLAAKWFKLQTLGLQKRSCLLLLSPLRAGFFLLCW
jgi:hypothetical protein